MARIAELLRRGRYEQLWQMCCGFIDLRLEQFMVIQENLLLEQIGMLSSCELGRKLMRGAVPITIEDFRKQLPLTTYADYCPELLEQREDILPAKPILWQRTSGKSGEYPCKWVPISQRFAEELGILLYGAGIFAGCEGRGDVSSVRKRAKIVYAVAPRPYTSGVMAWIMEREGVSDYLPPLEQAEEMPFEGRVREGFRLALSKGFDYFFGLSTVLVVVGEQFGAHSQRETIAPLLSQPGALFRLARGLIRSKSDRRPMLPRDLWSVRGIMGGGADSSALRERIRSLWGRYPLETYVCSEGGLIATQTWDYRGMTFVPNLNFLEFIPEAEYSKWRLDPSYQPRTVLLDEVKAGEIYEIVITNFHGGAMVRYRVGDMVRITAMRNVKLGIDIPQMIFERRADDLIDIAGFTRLTERIIWQAVEDIRIPYEDWTVRKEIDGGKPILHLYLEVKKGYTVNEHKVESRLHNELKKLDSDWADLETILGMKPIEVSLLQEGAFKAYMAERQAEGADLAHIKPPHINPSDKVLSWLGVKVKAASKMKGKA